MKVLNVVALCASVWLITAVAPAPAVASACPGADRSSTMTRSQWTHAVRCVVSAERRHRGLRVWHPSRRLAAAARKHARDMVRRRYFGHRSPGGGSLLQRVGRTGYFHRCMPCTVGENLAWGSGADGRPRAVVHAWLRSPPHRRVLLSRRFREVGVGVVPGAPMRPRAPSLTAVLVAGGHR